MLQRPSIPTPHSDNPDEVGFTFKGKVRIGIASLVVASGLTFIYSRLDEDQRDVFNFGSAAFGVCITGVSAFHAYRGIMQSSRFQEMEARVNKKDKIIDRTIDYIGRWNHPDYAHIKATVNEILTSIDDQEHTSVIDYLKDKPLKTQEVTSILNFLEELSFLIYEDIIDKQMAYIFYRGIIIRCYEVLVPHIMDRRNKVNNKKIYEQLEKLYFEWKDTDVNSNGNGNGNGNEKAMAMMIGINNY